MQFRRHWRVGAAALVAAGGLVAYAASSGAAATRALWPGHRAAAETTIGVDLTYNNTDFWSAYINYESQYAKQMHIKLLGPDLAGASASTQNQQIEELVNQGAKAIIINPETATSVGPAITYARQAPRQADLGRHDRRRRQGLHGGSRVQHALRAGCVR